MQKGRDMADSDKGEEALASRRKLYMDQDFDPGHCSMPFDMRLALAAEYAAYQLGQINRKLDRLLVSIAQGARPRMLAKKACRCAVRPVMRGLANDEGELLQRDRAF